MIVLYRCLLLLSVGALTTFIYYRNNGIHSEFSKTIELIPYADKVGHFFIFGVLTLLALLATNYHRIRIKPNTYLYTMSVVLLFAAIIEECSQLLIPSRAFEFADLFANVGGVVIFTYFAKYMPQHLRQRK